MVRLLDRPGIGAEFLNSLALQAADELGLKTAAYTDSPMMRELKAREVQLADTILVASELQARVLRQGLDSRKRVSVLPLWADSEFWRPPDEPGRLRSGPLRVIYAGKLSLRKGVPYLVRAAVNCSSPIALTLVGTVDPELAPLLEQHEGKFTWVAPCAKAELRNHYQKNDLLVLPSLGDSFGFVAMEAMACGLPVIVTENCGVPVPDAAWRVPVMDADAIATRLSLYAGDHDLCHEQGRIAADFARQYTPEHYRRQLHDIFHQLLSCAGLEAQPEAPLRINSPAEQFAEASGSSVFCVENASRSN
jgi:glycosyltransferase involved in cell wall biosynthesis